MDTNNEILDAIEILAGKKISENITKVLTGICKSVNINNNTCVMDSNGVSSTVQFYGSPPEVNELYRIFVPSNDMSRSFIVVPPKFTVNPNLLDNWYFANPVNQRGQTSYTGNGYTVDRWKMQLDIGIILLEADGIILDATANALTLVQFFGSDLLRELAGNTLTWSVMYTILEQSGAPGGLGYTIPGNYYAQAIMSGDVGKLCVASGSISAPTNLEIPAQMYIPKGCKIKLIAAKLELGSTQTLAHLENGSWVLNEVPEYGEQLRRCQRYYYQAHYFQYQTINMAYEDTAYAFIMLPLPVEMRIKNPVLIQSAPILLGSSEKTLASAEAMGCMARLGINYSAISNADHSCYSYCPSGGGVTFILSADL